MDTYLTIEQTAEGMYKDKGSKFLASVHHVESAERAMEIVAEYRRKFYDARHVCYAYMLGAERDVFRSNDDSEPSGTAGKPILGQINSASLTDVLIVVVRYFGGVLLGTSGLITAYKSAAADAIANATVVERVIEGRVELRFGYTEMSYVMRVVKEMQARIVEQEQMNDCRIVVTIRRDDMNAFAARFRDVKGITVR